MYNAWKLISLKMINEQKETNKQGRRKEERKRRARRKRGNVGLKAHEVTPDHPEKECTVLEILKLEETLKIRCYLHSVLSLLFKCIDRDRGN